MTLPVNYQDARPPTGALTELPATTSRGLNAINAKINANTAAIAALGVDPKVVYVDTMAGANDTAKILAARTAVGSSGVMVFSARTYTLTSPVAEFNHHHKVIGPGIGLCRIMYSGTGACFRARDTRAWIDQPHALADTAGAGMGFSATGFTIDGTGSGVNSSGLHVGDMNAIDVDLWIINFANTGGKGLWLDNTVTWTEQANVIVSTNNCKQGVVIECTTGYSSFDYSNRFWIQAYPLGHQDGVVIRGGVEFAGSDFTLVGGCDTYVGSGETNTGTVLSIGAGAGDGSRFTACKMHVIMEIGAATPSAFTSGHKPLVIGPAAHISQCVGIIKFYPRGPEFEQWQPAETGGGSRITFSGVLDVPADVGRMVDMQAFRATGLMTGNRGYWDTSGALYLGGGNVFLQQFPSGSTPFSISTDTPLTYPQAGTFDVFIKQPNSGAAATINWSGVGIQWAGGSPPVLTTVHNAIDHIRFTTVGDYESGIYIGEHVNPKTTLVNSVFNVLAYGATGNGSTNDRAAITAADTAAAGKPLWFPTGTYSVATNLTITSPVVMQPGAVIKPSSGVTVTLAGGVTAPPLQRIFDHSSSGLVVPKGVEFYHPGWWGPVNSSNDSQSWIDMQAAITASVASVLGITFGQKVLVPNGINTVIGVVLSSCDLYAALGGSVFVPPTATTSGVVLTLGNYTRLTGGSFATTQSGQAVTCLYLSGYRAQADGIYAFNQAASSTAVKLGDLGSGSTSPILTNARIISGLTTPASNSIGVDIQSSDCQLSNITVGQYNVGIKGQNDSGRWTNIHVWGNNTGITGSSMDGTQVANLYLDSNRGWGMDVDHLDRSHWHGIYAWSNGNAIGATGAIRFQTSGNFCKFTGIVLDDNVGHGIKLDGVSNYEIDATVYSASFSTVTTVGVEITSASDHTTLNLRGAYATTMLINSSATTTLAAPPSRAVRGSNLVKNASTTLAVLLSVDTQPGRKYLIRGALVVQGNQAADMSVRLQNSGATSPSGYFAIVTPLANSSTAATAASASALNNADIASGGGATVDCGLVTATRYVIPITGYLVAGSGSSQTLDCMVAQSVSDASDTTFYAGSWMEVQEVA